MKRFAQTLLAASLLLLATCHAPRPTVVRPASSTTTPTFNTPDGLPATPPSFQTAKKAAHQIHADHRITFYCGCAFDDTGHVDAESCGYRPRKSAMRGARIEWEHIVPAHAFGGHRPCWQQELCTDRHGRAFGGRKCCGTMDPAFRRMESDLRNLVPAVGELNGDRSNFAFGEIAGEERVYGACDFEVNRAAAVAECAASLRGDVARAYLYMHAVYGEGLPLSDDELARLRTWDAADPMDTWERVWTERVASAQGQRLP